MQIKITEDLRAGDFVSIGGDEYEITAIAGFTEKSVIHLNTPKHKVDQFEVVLIMPKGKEILTS